MIEAQGERLLPEEKLRRRPEYLHCYDVGRRIQGRMATLFWAPNGGECARLGITASRKVGPAVVRNRLRRRCREVYRRWPQRLNLPAVDIVVNLRHPAVTAEFSRFRLDFEGQLSRLIDGAGA